MREEICDFGSFVRDVSGWMLKLLGSDFFIIFLNFYSSYSLVLSFSMNWCNWKLNPISEAMSIFFLMYERDAGSRPMFMILRVGFWYCGYLW